MGHSEKEDDAMKKLANKIISILLAAALVAMPVASYAEETVPVSEDETAYTVTLSEAENGSLAFTVFEDDGELSEKEDAVASGDDAGGADAVSKGGRTSKREVLFGDEAASGTDGKEEEEETPVTEQFSEGDLVSIDILPDEGYELADITVTDENGDEIDEEDILLAEESFDGLGCHALHDILAAYEADLIVNDEEAGFDEDLETQLSKLLNKKLKEELSEEEEKEFLAAYEKAADETEAEDEDEDAVQSYVFAMPAEDVSVTAEFEETDDTARDETDEKESLSESGSEDDGTTDADLVGEGSDDAREASRDTEGKESAADEAGADDSAAMDGETVEEEDDAAVTEESDEGVAYDAEEGKVMSYIPPVTTINDLITFAVDSSVTAVATVMPSGTGTPNGVNFYLGTRTLDSYVINNTNLVWVGENGDTKAPGIAMTTFDDKTISSTTTTGLATLYYKNVGSLGDRQVDAKLTLTKIVQSNHSFYGGTSSREGFGDYCGVFGVNGYWFVGDHTVHVVDYNLTLTYADTGDTVDMPSWLAVDDLDTQATGIDYYESAVFDKTKYDEFYVWEDCYLVASTSGNNVTFSSTATSESVNNEESFYKAGVVAATSGGYFEATTIVGGANGNQLNAYSSAPPEDPQKTVTSSQTTYQVGDTVSFSVTQKMPKWYEDTYDCYTSMTMYDVLPDGLTYQDGSATMKSGSTTLSSSNFSYSNNTLTYDFSKISGWLSNKDNYNGQTLTMTFDATVTDAYEGEGLVTVTNKAYTEINGVNFGPAEADVDIVSNMPATSPAKELTGITHNSGTPETTSGITPKNGANDEAFAVYCSSDTSLTFYYGDDVPSAGDTYNGKTVTNVYTGVESTGTSSSSQKWSGHRSDITTVTFDSSFASARPTSCYYWFYNMQNLTKINGIKYLNTSSVTTMSYMFYYCSGLTVLDVSGFDTSNVTNMNRMFYRCSALMTLDVSGFDTSKVTDMAYMFYYDSSLTTIFSDDANFVTSAVTSGSSMFSSCSSLVGGYGTKHSTSHTTYAYAHVDTADNPGYFTQQTKEAFAVYCSSDTSLTFYYDDAPSAGSTYNGKTVTRLYTGVESTGTSQPWSSYNSSITNVTIDPSFASARPTSCYRWFYNMTKLTVINGLSYLNTARVTTMYYMFYGCSALTSLNVSGFDTSNVTTMYRMFGNCSALTSLNVSGFDTSNVTTMYGMFRACSALTTLDVSGWDTKNVTNMGYMFYDCSSLTTIFSDDANFVTASVTSGSAMFSGCSSLVGGNGTKYSASQATHAYAHVDADGSAGYFTGKSTFSGDTVSYRVTQAMGEWGYDTFETYASLVMTDVIPDGLTYVNNSAAMYSNGTKLGSSAGSFSYSSSTKTLTYTFSSSWLSNTGNYAGQDLVMTFDCTVDNVTAYRTVVNTASATVDGNVKDTNDVIIEVLSLNPELSITKTADKEQYQVGDTVTYTIEVKQTVEGATATGVVVSDTLPSGLTLGSVKTTSGSTSTSGNSFTVTCSTLSYGTTVTITVTATATAAGNNITNTATVKADNADQKSASATISVIAPNLEITKTADQSTYNVGDTVTYTITVRQTVADATANDVVISDTLPSSLTLVSVTTTSGSRATSGNSFTVTCSSLSYGTTVTITVTATATTTGNSIKNTAYVSSSNADEKSASATIKVVNKDPNFSITKTADKETYYVGDTVTYTIEVTETAENASGKCYGILDELPEELRLISATAYSSDKGDLTNSNWFDYGTNPSGNGYIDFSEGYTLSYGEYITITITAEAIAPGEGIVNTAILYTDVYDPVGSDDATIDVLAPELAITKTADQDTYNVGDTVTYTITVKQTVQGATATGVVVSDTLPDGLTIVGTPTISGVGKTVSGSYYSDTIKGTGTETATFECSLGTFDPATFEVDVDDISLLEIYSYSNGDLNTNYYEIDAAQIEQDARGNTFCDIKVVGRETFDKSDQYEASFQIKFTYSAQSQASVSGQTVTASLGELAYGDTITITVQATVTSSLAGSSVTNTATVTADNADDKQAVAVINITSNMPATSPAKELTGITHTNGTPETTSGITPKNGASDQAFAVYCSSDTSLTFYYGDDVPSAGDTYCGKTVTNVYTGIESTGTGSASQKWSGHRTDITTVTFDPSFASARPTSCYYWFYGMTNLSKINGIKYLNTSRVTTMYDMFRNCSALTSLDVSGFDTSNVTTMYYMFYGCSALTTLDVSGWDTAKVTNMQYMFYNCSSLTTIYSDDAHFVTTAVTSGSGMFSNCSSLVGGNGTTYSASHATYSYAHVDADGNPGYFTQQTKEAFAVYCSSDTSLTFYYDDAPSAGSTYNGKTVTSLYTGVESTSTSSNPPWYSYRTSFTTVTFDPSFASARPTSCYRWFYGMTKLTEIDGLSYLNTARVTTMYEMFYNCTALTSLNVSMFDTSSVTNMYGMFYGCSALTSLNVSGFDTSSVTTMYYMFGNCSALTSLNVNGFDTSNVTTMHDMFRACSNLTTLDVSGWDTAKVTDMGYMFYGCSKLTTIFSDDMNFVTSAVTTGTYMFTNCSNLVGGNGTTFSSSYVTYAYAHVDADGNAGYFTGKSTYPGDTVSYRVTQAMGTWGDDTFETYANLVITDGIPDELTYVNNSAKMYSDGVDVTNTAGTFTYDEATHTLTYTFSSSWLSDSDNYAGQDLVMTFDCTVDGVTTNTTVVNTASATVDDNVKDTNEVVIEVVPALEPELVITKTADKETYTIGDTVTYTITVTQTVEGATATNVGIYDLLPNNLQVSESGITVYVKGARSLQWDLDDNDFELYGRYSLEYDDTIMVTITATAVEAGSGIVNTATAYADDLDNISDDAVINIIAPDPDPGITKTSDKTTYSVGDTVTYTITITQPVTDAEIMHNLYIDDILPAEVAFVSISATLNDAPYQLQRQSTGSEQEIRTNTFDLEGDDVLVITISCTAIQAGSALVNSVGLKQGDNTLCEDTAEIEILSPALSITKTADKETYYVGDTVTYTITIEQTVEGATWTGIFMWDNVPDNLEVTNVTGNKNGTTYGSNTLRWEGRGDNYFELDDYETLEYGGQITITVTCTALKAGSSITNTAYLVDESAWYDPFGEAEATIDVIEPEPEPALAITKTADKETYSVGDTVTYTIVVAQTVPDATATNVVISDLAPAGISFTAWKVEGVNDYTLSEEQGTVTIPGLSYGETVTITITGTISEEVSKGAIITNTTNTAYAQADEVPSIDDDATIQIVEEHLNQPTKSITNITSPGSEQTSAGKTDDAKTYASKDGIDFAVVTDKEEYYVGDKVTYTAIVTFEEQTDLNLLVKPTSSLEYVGLESIKLNGEDYTGEYSYGTGNQYDIDFSIDKFHALSAGDVLEITATYTAVQAGTDISKTFIAIWNDGDYEYEACPSINIKDYSAVPGDTVSYAVTETMGIWDEDTYSTYDSLVFSDAIPDGLTYVDGSARMYSDGEDITDIAGVFTYEDGTLTYTFNSDWLANEDNYAGQDLVMTFDCTVDDTEVDETIINTAQVAIGDTTLNTNEVPVDVNVPTYGFELDKVDSGGNTLTGASFAMYDEEENRLYFAYDEATGAYTLCDTGDNGATDTIQAGDVSIDGLKEGAYKIVETNAPDGYVLAQAPVCITIDEDGLLLISGNAKITDEGVLWIINDKAVVMPNAEGKRLIWAILIGGAVIGAGFLYNTARKRRRKETVTL